MSIFDSAGKFVRSFNLRFVAESAAFPSLIVPFSTGTLLIGLQRILEAEELATGLRRESVTYLRCDMEGAVLDTIGIFPGEERYVAILGDGIEVVPRGFGRSPRVAVYKDDFFYGSGDFYEIGKYASDGTLRRLIRVTRPNRALSETDIEHYRQVQLEPFTDEFVRRVLERVYTEMPYPATMPAYGQMVTDAQGHLWVAEYPWPTEDQPRWTVFDPEGVMLGIVETPPRFTVYQIGSDFVLGRWRDELDVEHVQIYRLIKA